MSEWISAISTLVAALSMAFAAWTYFRGKRDAALYDWQVTAMLELFQRNAERIFDYDELLSRYRVEAGAYDKINVGKASLTPQVVRKVLKELLSRGLVIQVGADQYRCRVIDGKSDSPDFLSTMLQAALEPIMGKNGIGFGDIVENVYNESVKNVEVANRILGYVYDNPFEKTENDVIVKVGSELSVPSETVRASLIKIIAQGFVAIRTDKTLGPAHRAGDVYRVEGL